MKYLHRTIEGKIRAVSKEYSCLILTGPRQVGKSTVLRHLMEGTARKEVSLDDLTERRLAKQDPELFLEMHPTPILIDEIQYAPELFSYIKMRIDNGAEPGAYWLTGSQAFRLMELAQESLAGRAAILHLSTLTQSELYGDGDSPAFSPDIAALRDRQTHGTKASPLAIYERIWLGGMPGFRSGKYTDRDLFYSSYVQSYIERDVAEMIGGIDKLQYADFIRAVACRVGQILNVHDVAMDVGVSDDTAKRWLSILEKSEVIFYLRPFSNNLLKRTVKTPKLYFFDTGLVAYLTRYASPEVLMNGAINGAILENYIVAEIMKSYRNQAKDCLLHYYRDKDAREIDLVIEEGGMLYPIEIKKSTNPAYEWTGAFKLLDKATLPRGIGAIICLRDDLSALDRQNLIIPAWII